MTNLFDLTGKVAVVTGGAGLLGLRHCEVLLAAGAQVVCLDLRIPEGEFYDHLRPTYFGQLSAAVADVTGQGSLLAARDAINRSIGPVDVLVNNAANNPKVEKDGSEWIMDLHQWNEDIAAGLTGAMLCSKVFGEPMAQRGHGVILNIASEYALIAPDQRLYRKPGLLEHQQPIKPSSYSVVKHGLVGLTKWLATYWAGKGVRVNCLSPGGVYDNQPEEFVERYVNTIPLGRMACPTDMQGAVLFLCSDASSFVTGANVVVDGGRSCW